MINDLQVTLMKEAQQRADTLYEDAEKTAKSILRDNIEAGTKGAAKNHENNNNENERLR